MPTEEPKQKSSETWGKVLPAVTGIVGTLLGASITLLSAAYVESTKQFEIQKAEAIAAYLESAWGESETDHLDFSRKLSLLTVYAPHGVLEEVWAYQNSPCIEQGDETAECRGLWADVVHELRKMTGADPVPSKLVIEILWGSGE